MDSSTSNRVNQHRPLRPHCPSSDARHLTLAAPLSNLRRRMRGARQAELFVSWRSCGRSNSSASEKFRRVIFTPRDDQLIIGVRPEPIRLTRRTRIPMSTNRGSTGCALCCTGDTYRPPTLDSRSYVSQASSSEVSMLI